MIRKLIFTDNSRTTILIRLIVGIVFLSEGIQKFLFPALGATRFANIGFAHPEFVAAFTGSFEILCGTMVLLGFLTRFASIPLIIIMLVAIITTKISILGNDGFWKMMHESRTDLSMLTGSIFLLISGAGKWSVDRILIKQDQSSI
jgi:putative oxidoreductase